MKSDGGKEPPTIAFNDRYHSDPEFKRQVDDARKRSAQKQSLKALQSALDMQRNGKKHY